MSFLRRPPLAARTPKQRAGAAAEEAARVAWACGVLRMGLTPEVTGAGGRRPQGTTMGHEHAEGMAHGCVRVDRPVRLGRVVEGVGAHGNLAVIR